MHYLKGVRMPTHSLDNLSVYRQDGGGRVPVRENISIEEARDAVVYLREEVGLEAEQIEVAPQESHDLLG